jgi:hypothetical protein
MLLQALWVMDLQAVVILQGGDVNVGSGIDSVLAGWQFDVGIAFEGVKGVAFAGGLVFAGAKVLTVLRAIHWQVMVVKVTVSWATADGETTDRWRDDRDNRETTERQQTETSCRAVADWVVTMAG